MSAGSDGMRRSTSVAGYPHRIPKTKFYGLIRPMAEVDHEEGYRGWIGADGGCGSGRSMEPVLRAGPTTSLRGASIRRWLLILAILASVVTAVGAATPTPEEVRETTGMAIDYHPGKGPTLVFIHGWTCNRTHWKKQMPRFKGGYEIVTLDMAGHGESAAKKSEWTVSGLAEGVVEVIEALDLDRVILIGHSMGGAVAVAAAPRAKGRVIGIIGVDTLQNAEFTISGEQVNEVVANFERDYPAAMAGFIDGFFASRPEATETKVFVQKTMGKVRPEIAISLLRSYLEMDAPRAFRGAGVPIHCINAAMPYGTEIEINRKYAEFDADLVKNVTHFLMLEKPEEFNPLLEKAIEKLAKENKEESSRMSHPSHIHHAIPEAWPPYAHEK